MAFGIGSAQAGLVGSTVHARLLFPDTATTFDDYGTFVITGNENLVSSDQATSLGFSNTQVIVMNLTPGQYDPAATFDGYDLDFLAGITITGAVLDPASSPLFATGAQLTVNGNDIRLNFAGTCALCTGGEQIFIDVSSTGPGPAPLPEPASLPLVGCGLLGLVFASRRRA